MCCYRRFSRDSKYLNQRYKRHFMKKRVNKVAYKYCGESNLTTSAGQLQSKKDFWRTIISAENHLIAASV